MRSHILLALVVPGVLVICPNAATADQDVVLFSAGAPTALDVGEGNHYYAVQSILGIEWYPSAGGAVTAAGDWFQVAADAELTGITFWGILKSYGGGPDALHVFVYDVAPGTGALTERLHAWHDDTDSWAAYFAAEEDPAGLGSETVGRWQVRLADLPHRSGDTCLAGGATYMLAVAGDDWADEFQWAAGAPGGLVGGNFDSLHGADSTDVNSTGLNWATSDLGQGPIANNLAFVVVGRPVNTFGDVDANCLIDLVDFAAFGPCFSMIGPGETWWEQCLADFDVNADQLIDLADFAAFQQSFTGSGQGIRCCVGR